jgi:hypothetical protein
METYAFAETGTRITRWLFCSVDWFSVTTILPQASDQVVCKEVPKWN